MHFFKKLSSILGNFFNLPENFFTIQNRYLIVATVFGLGYAKKAPGTVTSLVTVLIAILIGSFNTKIVLFLFIISLIIGLFVSEKVHTIENPDPSHIVIDEVTGQLLAVLLVCNNFWLSILSFCIFRILDITKPWLIGKSETTFHGGLGIMIDDLLAGFVALFITTAIALFLQ